MTISWRVVLIVAAVILFIVAGLVGLATISGPAPLALVAFGLACLAASFLPL